jgi:hypothetical protein
MTDLRFSIPFLALTLFGGLVPDARADLLVSGGTNVLEYNGTTGAFVKTFASGGGLSIPAGLVFGPSGDLFVSGFTNNAVLEYNGTTGAFVETFTSGGGLANPTYLAFSPTAARSRALDLYVARYRISRFLGYADGRQK